MSKNDLIKNLKVELYKIEKQNKVYGVGETRYDLMIKDVLNYINNSIPKHIIQDILKQIRKNEQLAGECIEQTIIIADSDSLNYGRAEAHNCDAVILEELLEGK